MEQTGLTTFAWIFMIVSMGSVTVLTAYCFYRILTTPRSPEPAPPAERERGARREPGSGGGRPG